MLHAEHARGNINTFDKVLTESNKIQRGKMTFEHSLYLECKCKRNTTTYYILYRRKFSIPKSNCFSLPRTLTSIA